MNLLDIAHLLEELLRSEAKVIAFFIVGVCVTVAAFYTLKRWVLPPADVDKEILRRDKELAKQDTALMKRETEIARLEKKAEELDRQLQERDRKLTSTQEQAASTSQEHQREKSVLQERIVQLSRTCEALKEEEVEASSAERLVRQQKEQAGKEFETWRKKAIHVLVNYKKQVLALNGKLTYLNEQMRDVEQSQGRFWESPIRVSIAPFRRLEPGGVPAIIAVTNLKGGVGKTSLTANLAATYWRMGKRVLVVDLDYQASLTFLCLSHEQINDLRPGGGRYVQNVLSAKTQHADVAWNNLTRMNNQGAYILAASEELTDVEEHLKAQWLLRPLEADLRYVLRAALHHPSIQSRFDVILLDCPPRLTPASINALTCADYALIPALLDRTSTEAVPRLLTLLRRLKEKICPDLAILGVVGNRAYPRAKLILREKTVWEDLVDRSKTAWGEPVYHFHRFVPASSQFAEAATDRVFAAHHASLEPIFTELVEELHQRKASHESSRVAAVP